MSTENKKTNPPLLPDDALNYYNIASDKKTIDFHKPLDIRFCLENIVRTVFIHISGINSVGKMKGKWKNGTLNQRLEMMSDYFPENILNKIHNIRKISSNGCHEENNNLRDIDIKNAIVDLEKLCEWTILSYFKKYGFNVHPWLPTIFSTLPPVYRINILEELFKDNSEETIKDKNLIIYQQALDKKRSTINNNIYITPEEEYKLFSSIETTKFDETFLLVDKLSMAYLKNDEYDKSIEFIRKCYEEKIIHYSFKNDMVEKINMMKKELKQFNISKNFEEAKSNFLKIRDVIEKEDQSLFVTIFTAVIAQKELAQFN